MSGRRLALVHTPADDRGPESSSPNIHRRTTAVTGFATFYLSGTTGWEKIPPGRLDLAELWGGGSGFGNHEFNFISSRLFPPEVQFYINLRKPSKSYVAAYLPNGEIYTFGFFGRRI